MVILGGASLFPEGEPKIYGVIEKMDTVMGVKEPRQPWTGVI